MIVKICGLKNQENIEEIALLSPDYLGFIFYDKSPRFVGNLLNIDFMRRLSKNILTTAVFVNASLENIISTVKLYGFRVVQLHGEESPEFCLAVKKTLGDTIKVIKAFGIFKQFNFDSLKQYEPGIDYFMFDTKGLENGGTGKVFDWKLLENYSERIPYFLSGGLGNEELKTIHKSIRVDSYLQYCAGIDLNSKLEDSPGHKNIIKVAEAISQIKNFQ